MICAIAAGLNVTAGPLRLAGEAADAGKPRRELALALGGLALASDRSGCAAKGGKRGEPSTPEGSLPVASAALARNPAVTTCPAPNGGRDGTSGMHTGALGRPDSATDGARADAIAGRTPNRLQ